MKNKLVKKNCMPICFTKLKEIKYKLYYKSEESCFNKTKHYNVNKFYKPIANL